MSLDLEQALEAAHLAVRVVMLPSGKCAILSWHGDLSTPPEWICELAELPYYIQLEQDRRREYWRQVDDYQRRRHEAPRGKTTPLTSVTKAMDYFK